MIPRNRAYGDSCNFIGGGLYPLCGYAMVALHKGYNSRLYRNQSKEPQSPEAEGPRPKDCCLVLPIANSDAG